MEKIIEALEKNNIQIYEYKEDGKLCGYELNTYTSGGVNMLIFLDFREKGNPKDVDDFLNEFEQYLKDFDIDEEIDLHRQDQRYKDAFRISESVNDFNGWKKNLKKLIKRLKVNINEYLL